MNSATGLLTMPHEGGVAEGFLSGFLHPILGPDHVVTMIAVGLWGAQLGKPALWVLPIAFPMVMALGGTLAIVGLAVPGVELGIAISALVLGLMVAMAVRPPLWVAAVLVGAFAIFHGHAHGTELPQSANPLAYALGFVFATGLLHGSGIALGIFTGSRAGALAVRACGGIIAAVGVYFVVMQVTQP